MGLWETLKASVVRVIKAPAKATHMTPDLELLVPLTALSCTAAAADGEILAGSTVPE